MALNASSSAPARRGFTLVELLVVIGIIAILGAISFAGMNSALVHARIAGCEGNLRTIGAAMLSFAADNNGNLPESGGTIPYGTIDGTTKQYGWTQQLEGYLGTGTAVYQCPDSSKTVAGNATYSYFNGAHAALSQTGGFGPVNLMKMQAASKHIISGDIAYGSLFQANDADKDDYTQDPAFNGNVGTIPIHRGTANILFADGHVQNVSKFDNTSMTTVYSGYNTDYLHP